MSRLNWKYEGTIIKSENKNVVPEDEWVLFRVTDKYLWPTLNFYKEQCKAGNCSKEHLDDVQGLIDRVEEWQRRNSDRVKVPD